MKPVSPLSPLALAALAGGALEEQPGATLVPGSGPGDGHPTFTGESLYTMP